MRHLKEEFDKLTFKDMLAFTMAVLSLIGGFVLLFLGLFIAPEGEIHDSVLMAFGSILIFVGMLMGYSMKMDADFAKFKSAVNDKLDGMACGKEVAA